MNGYCVSRKVHYSLWTNSRSEKKFRPFRLKNTGKYGASKVLYQITYLLLKGKKKTFYLSDNRWKVQFCDHSTAVGRVSLVRKFILGQANYITAKLLDFSKSLVEGRVLDRWCRTIILAWYHSVFENPRCWTLEKESPVSSIRGTGDLYFSTNSYTNFSFILNYIIFILSYFSPLFLRLRTIALKKYRFLYTF